MSAPLAKTDIFNRVCIIIADCLASDVNDIQLDSYLFNDLGIDSLDFLDIVFGVEREFLIKFRKTPFEKFLRLDTLVDEKNQSQIPIERLDAIKKFLPALQLPPNEPSISVITLMSSLTTETLVLAIEDCCYTGS
ncbi:Acyl carrier protein [hydrothermal vent metagenome]|uniref:Acyl carrier protein n=1 Tax=hydrothermal vent metagenome TaxID=652676 RepID=A0A3B0Z386_9ZZZZ